MTVMGHASETDVFENLIVEATLADANATTSARSDIAAIYAPFYALE